MHTQHSFVALVPTGDRRRPVSESTSTTKTNNLCILQTPEHLALVGIVCLVALTIGCATVPSARPTVPRAGEGHRDDWLGTEPAVEGAVTTPARVEDGHHWYDPPGVGRAYEDPWWSRPSDAEEGSAWFDASRCDTHWAGLVRLESRF